MDLDGCASALGTRLDLVTKSIIIKKKFQMANRTLWLTPTQLNCLMSQNRGAAEITVQ